MVIPSLQAQSLFESAKSRGMNINQALLSEIARARRDAQRATSHMYSKIFSSSTSAMSRSSVASSAQVEERDEQDSDSTAKHSVAANAADLSYQPAMTAAGRYMLLFNLLMMAGWTYVLGAVAAALVSSAIEHGQDWGTASSVIEAAGTPVLMWQTITMFEIFHAAFELSPGASITAVCVTFAERMMLLIACLLPFPQLRTNAYVSLPFIAWSATNVVRFAYFASGIVRPAYPLGSRGHSVASSVSNAMMSCKYSLIFVALHLADALAKANILAATWTMQDALIYQLVHPIYVLPVAMLISPGASLLRAKTIFAARGVRMAAQRWGGDDEDKMS